MADDWRLIERLSEKIDGCGFSTTHRKGCGPIAVCQRWGLPNTICEISTAVMKKSKPSRRYTNLSPGRSPSDRGRRCSPKALRDGGLC